METGYGYCHCGCGEKTKLSHANTGGYRKGSPRRFLAAHHFKCMPRVDGVKRFWDKVDKTNDCWEWTANKYPSGYGCFKINGTKIGAHRFSWILVHGQIPVSLFVLHKCDNPGCVNPDHLFIGTQRDNMHDRMKKKRHVYGEKHKSCKLTESQVRDIWYNYKKTNPSVLAREHGVTRRCIRAIHDGLNWKWLTSTLTG